MIGWPVCANPLRKIGACSPRIINISSRRTSRLSSPESSQMGDRVNVSQPDKHGRNEYARNNCRHCRARGYLTVLPRDSTRSRSAPHRYYSCNGAGYVVHEEEIKKKQCSIQREISRRPDLKDSRQARCCRIATPRSKGLRTGSRSWRKPLA
jgi:hypothetical protein